jgi:hypothetical protein
VPGSKDKYVALFNTADTGNRPVVVGLKDLGFSESARVRDLWRRVDLEEEVMNEFAPVLPPHGAGLYRFTPLASPE